MNQFQNALFDLTPSGLEATSERAGSLKIQSLRHAQSLILKISDILKWLMKHGQGPLPPALKVRNLRLDLEEN